MSSHASAIPADTSPDVWRAQMRAMGALTVAQRLALWEQLNEALEQMERAAILRQHPDFTEEEQQAEFVRRRHGADLARAVWPHLTRVHSQPPFDYPANP